MRSKIFSHAYEGIATKTGGGNGNESSGRVLPRFFGLHRGVISRCMQKGGEGSEGLLQELVDFYFTRGLIDYSNASNINMHCL